MNGAGLRILAVSLLLAATVPFSPSTPGATPSAQEIDEMTELGRNEEAARAAAALLTEAEARYGEHSAPVAEALELRARALARAHQGDLQGKAGRLKLALRALEIRRDLFGESGPEVAWSYYVVGLVHHLAGAAAQPGVICVNQQGRLITDRRLSYRLTEEVGR